MARNSASPSNASGQNKETKNRQTAGRRGRSLFPVFCFNEAISMKKILLTNSWSSSIVSDRVFRKASRRKWCLDHNGHVISTDRPYLYLHHLVNGKPPKGLETDHRNGNRLDNRNGNLRNVTHSQNCMNRRKDRDNVSGFKGVHWHSRSKKWRVWIQIEGKQISLGCFSDPVEAAKVYDETALKFFGKFARPNFPMRFPRVRRFPRLP